jgi:hypothetical protein
MSNPLSVLKMQRLLEEMGREGEVIVHRSQSILQVTVAESNLKRPGSWVPNAENKDSSSK